MSNKTRQADTIWYVCVWCQSVIFEIQQLWATMWENHHPNFLFPALTTWKVWFLNISIIVLHWKQNCTRWWSNHITTATGHKGGNTGVCVRKANVTESFHLFWVGCASNMCMWVSSFNFSTADAVCVDGEHLRLKIAFTFDLRGNFCMCASTQMMMYLWLVAEKKVRKMLLLQPAPRSKACFYGWSNQKPLGWCIISQYFKGLFPHWWFHWNTWMFDISEEQLQQWL